MSTPPTQAQIIALQFQRIRVLETQLENARNWARFENSEVERLTREKFEREPRAYEDMLAHLEVDPEA